MEKFVHFSPKDELVFENVPNPSCEFQISNKWTRPVMYKLKSTRPNVMRMRPVFGTINVNEIAKVKLSIRAANLLDLNFTKLDHFTCVFCPTPANVVSNPSPRHVGAVFRANDAKEIHRSLRKVFKIKIGKPGEASKGEFVVSTDQESAIEPSSQNETTPPNSQQSEFDSTPTANSSNQTENSTSGNSSESEKTAN